MNLAMVTAATYLPVTLEEVKRHLRIDLDFIDGDPSLIFLLESATESAEIDKGMKFITQTWDYKLNAFPDGEIRLPCPPLQSVTHIKYIDTSGDEQTFSSDSYTVHTSTLLGKVTLAYGESWPSARNIEAAVTVRMVCGYTTAELVPSNIKHAILMAVGTGDAFRENMTMASRGQEPTPLKGQGCYDALIGGQVRFY